MKRANGVVLADKTNLNRVCVFNIPNESTPHLSHAF